MVPKLPFSFKHIHSLSKTLSFYFSQNLLMLISIEEYVEYVRS